MVVWELIRDFSWEGLNNARHIPALTDSYQSPPHGFNASRPMDHDRATNTKGLQIYKVAAGDPKAGFIKV